MWSASARVLCHAGESAADERAAAGDECDGPQLVGSPKVDSADATATLKGLGLSARGWNNPG